MALAASRAHHRRNKTLDSKVKTLVAECRRKRHSNHSDSQTTRVLLQAPNQFPKQSASAASGNASPKTTRKTSHKLPLAQPPQPLPLPLPLMEAASDSLAVRTRMSKWGKPGKPFPVKPELCLPVLASASAASGCMVAITHAAHADQQQKH